MQYGFAPYGPPPQIPRPSIGRSFHLTPNVSHVYLYFLFKLSLPLVHLEGCPTSPRLINDNQKQQTTIQ
jgi:hypothetical protein